METDLQVMEMVKGSIDAGGSGVSIGRNAFQHRQPKRLVWAISQMVHHNWSVDQAIKYLEGKDG